MKRVLVFASVAVAGSAMAFGPGVVSFTGGSQFATFHGSVQATPDMVGFQFNYNQNVIVTHLGIWEDTTGPLQSVHRISVWRVSDQQLMTSVNVDATDPLTNSFRYRSVFPVQLNAGVSYVIAADYWTTSGDNYLSTPSSVTYDPMMTHEGAVHPASANLGYVMPTTLSTTNRGRFGPNLITAPVPEPATMLLLGGGALALLRRRRR